MNGVHDMGGMHGFGPIPREENDRVFPTTWEGRMFGMLLALGSQGVHDPDGLRAALESLEPSQYLTLSYFERWLRITEKALQAKGFITTEELDQRMKDFSEAPEASLSRREDPALTARLMKAVHTRSPSNRESGISPRFQVGDLVAVRNVHPQRHTRLPRYVRGKRGSIARFHGVHDFHDDGSRDVVADPVVQDRPIRCALAGRLIGRQRCVRPPVPAHPPGLGRRKQHRLLLDR